MRAQRLLRDIQLFRLGGGTFQLVAAPALAGNLLGSLRVGPNGLVLADLLKHSFCRLLDNRHSWRRIPTSSFVGGLLLDGLGAFHISMAGRIYALDGLRLFQSADRCASRQQFPARELTYCPEPEPRIISSIFTPKVKTLYADTRHGDVYC